MKPIRVLADANFNRAILNGIARRHPEIQIVRAQDLQMDETPDAEILEYAAQQDFILLTHDKATISPLVFQRIQEGKHVPGVIVVPQDLGIGRAIEDVILLLTASLPGELENKVSWVPL